MCYDLQTKSGKVGVKINFYGTKHTANLVNHVLDGNTSSGCEMYKYLSNELNVTTTKYSTMYPIR